MLYVKITKLILNACYVMFEQRRKSSIMCECVHVSKSHWMVAVYVYCLLQQYVMLVSSNSMSSSDKHQHPKHGKPNQVKLDILMWF